MPEHEHARTAWLPIAALLTLLACFVLASLRTSPPEVAPASAPPGRFSAERAFSTLTRVLGSGAPHPTGSAENVAVRRRIVARLSELGWQSAELSQPSCGRYGACATVVNVVATRPGPPGESLLLSAHYDSVPAGAGAADDGMGVGTLLEVARALGHRKTELPVVLLFTDGEEAGLLGAEAFVKHELKRYAVAAIVNVEARGTSGPSLLFETSGPNTHMIEAYARAATRPVTSSLFAAVYELLPNDTDLSVFKRAGVPGLNLANIGGVALYHTPKDDLDHLSLRTLQHHGDITLGLTGELARAGGETGSSIFFDVLGLHVVRFGRAHAALVVGIASLAWLLAAALTLKRGARLSESLRSLLFCALLLSGATLAAFTLGALTLRDIGGAGGWLAHPEPFFLALTFTLLALALVAVRLANTSAQALWVGVWTLFGLLGSVVLFVLPEACFLFVVPVLGAALVGLATRGRLGALHVLLPAASGALLWLPVLLLAHDALGLAAPALFGAGTLVGLFGFVPALAHLGPRSRRFVLGLSISAALACTTVALLVPRYSESTPQRLSLAYHLDADHGRARWLVDASSGRIPPDLMRAGQFADTIVDSAPTFVGFRPEALAGVAPVMSLPSPQWQLVGAQPARVGHKRIRVVPARGPSTLRLSFPADSGVTEVIWEGDAAPLRQHTAFRSLTLLGVGSGGTELELVGTGNLAFSLSEHSPGLPESGQALQTARPAWAEPSQAGDETVVSRSVQP